MVKLYGNWYISKENLTIVSGSVTSNFLFTPPVQVFHTSAYIQINMASQSLNILKHTLHY